MWYTYGMKHNTKKEREAIKKCIINEVRILSVSRMCRPEIDDEFIRESVKEDSLRKRLEVEFGYKNPVFIMKQ